MLMRFVSTWTFRYHLTVLFCVFADIVPIYNLGQSHMLDFYGSCTLSRRMRAAVGVFWGRWFLPVPRRHDIIITVGRPVKGEST